MAQVKFNLNGTEAIIQCNKEDKMGFILDKFLIKTKKEKTDLYFLYNGSIVDSELKFEEQANEYDKKEGKMNILVNEKKGTNELEKNKNIKDSEVIICPDCGENSEIKIDKYNISMICKNGHKYKNQSIKEFINLQKIDISKIKCNICNINDKSNTYENKMFYCLNCDKLICPLCKINHNKNDIIIDSYKKNFYCKKHYETYNSYCKDCKKDLCIKCEKEHNSHNKISYGDIINDDYNEKEFDNYIDKLKNEINDIMIKLNKIIEYLELFGNKSKNIIKKNENRNYEILNGINKFINYNNKIINDIKQIINDNNNNRLKYLMDIYSQMYKEDKIIKENHIIAEINIKKEDIGKKIKIINSYEQFKRENDWYENDDDKYLNEKEMKDKCEIIIDDNKIPFNYFHEFDKEGKYEITFKFNTQNITNMIGMFAGCKYLTNINLSNFNTENITNMSYLFYGCESLTNIDLSNFNTEKVTDIKGMFSRCKSLTSIDLSNFNTKNIIDMSNLFFVCSSLTNINLSNFNTQKVTNISCMFSRCKSLVCIDLSNFNTENVTNMSSLFYGCESLKNIDLSNFNTEKVTNMNSMFYSCKSLTNINLSNFNTEKVTELNDIFYECKSLKKENIQTTNKKILEQLN